EYGVCCTRDPRRISTVRGGDPGIKAVPLGDSFAHPVRMARVKKTMYRHITKPPLHNPRDKENYGFSLDDHWFRAKALKR
ncbi:MAG: hypothetical protein PVF10_11740, partial [Syntrophobacterales bacterium]